MNQKAKRSRNYRDESTGSNVLFTLGLVSVVALLIVGWVMTKGGVDKVMNSGEGGSSPGISFFSSPTPAPQPTATPLGSTLNTTMPPANNQSNVNEAALRAQITDQLEKEYQNQLLEAQLQSEKDVQEVRMKLQSEIDDLKMQIKMLEIDNKRLREETEESSEG